MVQRFMNGIVLLLKCAELVFFLIERGRRNKSGGYPFRFDTLDTL